MEEEEYEEEEVENVFTVQYESWRKWLIDYALDTHNKELFDEMNGPDWKFIIMTKRESVRVVVKESLELVGWKSNG